MSESTAAAVIGLVVEEIGNIGSRRIGAPPTAITPAVATCTVSPRATAATTPGALALFHGVFDGLIDYGERIFAEFIRTSRRTSRWNW
jgi:hypothetical protein